MKNMYVVLVLAMLLTTSCINTKKNRLSGGYERRHLLSDERTAGDENPARRSSEYYCQFAKPGINGTFQYIYRRRFSGDVQRRCIHYRR